MNQTEKNILSSIVRFVMRLVNLLDPHPHQIIGDAQLVCVGSRSLLILLIITKHLIQQASSISGNVNLYFLSLWKFLWSEFCT